MTDSYLYVGIDPSKDKFDVAIPMGEGKFSSCILPNTEEGFAALAQKLPPSACCVVEATSAYHCRLALYLHEHGIAVSVVNPLSVKHFCRMSFQRAKTDKADAVAIARYGHSQRPPLWSPKEQALTQLRQLLTVREQLLKQQTALGNERKSFQLVPAHSKIAVQIIDNQLETLADNLKAIEEAINDLVKGQYQEIFERLQSIPGIGPVTAWALLLTTEGFTKFNHYKELIAYAGLAPRTFQSGKSVRGASHVCKLGGRFLRRLLYKCAESAIKFNPACKKLFERLFLQRNKHYRVARVAVANKLIKIVFAVATNNQNFDPNFQSKTK